MGPTVRGVVMQGLLEECGFRFLYICTAMLFILTIDYAIKGLLMILAGAMFYATFLSVSALVRRPINQLNRRDLLSVAIVASVGLLFAYLCTRRLSSLCALSSRARVSPCAHAERGCWGTGQQRSTW
jgi:uncharacterized protein YacL